MASSDHKASAPGALSTRTVAQLLAPLRAAVTLEQSYAQWEALEAERNALQRSFALSRDRVEQQGAFLLGAVRAAKDAAPELGAPPQDATGGALRRGEALDAYVREAQARLTQARARLAEDEAAQLSALGAACEEAREELAARLDRYLERVRPHVELLRRPLATGQAILHVTRPSPDEAVLLARLFTGKVPTRYGYLFDDSTDDAALPPTTLYPDAGQPGSDLRPAAPRVRGLLASPAAVLPVKAMLPWLPLGAAGPLYRLLARGPVLEVELARGDSFHGILSAEEAETFAGLLLRLELGRRIALALEVG